MSDELGALGLDARDQELYEELLTRPPVSADDLPEHDDAGSTLERLRRLGLVTASDTTPPRYEVVRADVALDALLALHRRELSVARQRVEYLANQYRRQVETTSESVELITDRYVAWQRYEQAQHSAVREVRTFDTPPYLGRKRECNPTEFEVLARGVRYRVLYDRSAVEIPGRIADMEECAEAGEQARITTVPMKLLLTDAPLAFVPLGPLTSDLWGWLLVREESLYEALSALFESLWEQALPLHVARRGERLPDHAGPSDTERALTALLASGLTDQAIADQLGVHKRTAHGHIRSLMSLLDATTRFQAGHQAVRRGWLSNSGVDDE